LGRASAGVIRNEECWVLVGRRRGRIWNSRAIGRCAGAPAHVEFDGPAVLVREERRRDIIGFLHTHPQFDATPSRRDIATMQAWVLAFGKPLLCLIRGRDGLKGYRFDDDRSEGIPLLAVEEFARGVIIGVDADGRNVSSRRAVSRTRTR
jgi:proteasome lid subunit RPN8/RPN11